MTISQGKFHCFAAAEESEGVADPDSALFVRDMQIKQNHQEILQIKGERTASALRSDAHST